MGCGSSTDGHAAAGGVAGGGGAGPQRSSSAPSLASGGAGGTPSGPNGAVVNPNNRRVRVPAAWRETGGQPLTQAMLVTRRELFWSSQSAGRALIWENLKVVSEALLQGNADLANALLEATDIRVPYADLSVCYDSLGQLYQVPRWAYSSPANVATEEEAAAVARLQRKEHSGPVTAVAVVMRLSPSVGSSEQDVALAAKSSDSVRMLKAALHAKLAAGDCDQLPDGAVGNKPNRWRGLGLPPRRQRIMFRGKELLADLCLQETGISDGDVLQVFVVGPPAQPGELF